MNLTLSCVQPSYLAWIPLFKRMEYGDVFVYLDDVEYSKNSSHNRNNIKTTNGKTLLTVPIMYKGNSSKFINEIPINNDLPWAKKHLRTIELNYIKSPFYSEVKENILNDIYGNEWKTLGDLNISFIEKIRKYLKINCKTYRSSELEIHSTGNQKLVDLCKLFNANRFIVKPNTEHYHPKEFFKKEGIQFSYFEPKPINYFQQHGEFVPDLSALDYAMNCGSGQLKW